MVPGKKITKDILEAISKPHLSTDICVADFLKILTYDQYAAFFRKSAP